MPMPSDIAYGTFFSLPFLAERGATNVLACPLVRDGAVVEPTSGTITITDRNGAPLMATTAATLVTYHAGNGGSDLLAMGAVWTPGASVPIQEGCRVAFALTLPDESEHTFINDLSVVLHRLYCPISDVDLWQAKPSLNPNDQGAISRQTSWQSAMDSAWLLIQSRLIEKGNRPNLILSPYSLREACIELTLANIFEDMATRLNDAYLTQAQTHRDRFEKAFSRVSFKYADPIGTGTTTTSGGEVVRPASGATFYGTRGTSRGRW